MTGKRIALIGLVLLGLTAAVVYASIFHKKDTLEGSGTVEARNIRVGSKVGGRISQVLVREGDAVTAGQVLVTFDEKELKATLDQSSASLEKMQRGYRPEEIAEARAAAAQAKADYEQRRNGYRQEDIAGAQADLERAQADEIRAKKNYERADNLLKKEVFSRQATDDAWAAWKMTEAQRQSAEQKLSELHRGYRPEEITSAEAHYHQTQAVLERMEHGNRREDIAQSRAQYDFDKSRYAERQVLAPSAATVEVLDVRPGDLVAPNAPVATLLERDQMYVRIYIPETRIGEVHVGQTAEVHLDALPGQTISAVVEQINQKAEFLPRNVQTKEERVHQVFGVKLRINDPSGRVRAGMAADVKLSNGRN
jgi:membrane fusion protein YbhG